MFRLLLSPKVLLTVAAFAVFSCAAFAQDGPPPGRDGRQNDRQPNPIEQLGLSPEQVKQFRELNQRHRPLMNDAQKRMRDANRELDMAIYADVVSDEDVRSKLKAFQEAQLEINRLRFVHELNIRKLLTLEQLVRFREMRRRFADSRQRNQRLNQRQRQNTGPMQSQDPTPRPANSQKRPAI
jgi:Spy/CpxP family protein refolding chaperone